jgi:hypothetical protein
MKSGEKPTTILRQCRRPKGISSGCISSYGQSQRHHSPHEFASVAAAQAFVNSDELKQAMQGGGVAGAPTIWFTNKK